MTKENKKETEKATEQLWGKEYIKVLGCNLLTYTFKYLNNELPFEEYEQIRKEHNERFRPFNDISAKNYEAFMIYNDLMVLMTDLRMNYTKRLKDFYEHIADIQYVTQLVLLAETEIRGELTYNLLLNEIPKEALKQMHPEFTKPKPVEETINTLASLNFVIDREKSNDNQLSYLFEPVTYLYCEMQCIKLIYDTIAEAYKVKERIILKDPLKQDPYINVCKTMAQIDNAGRIRIKDYEKTLFYRRCNRFMHLEEVKETKEYKEAEKEAKKHIKKYFKSELQKDLSGLLLLEDLMQTLCNKGWWFIDE